jgi:hypothetical protein
MEAGEQNSKTIFKDAFVIGKLFAMWSAIFSPNFAHLFPEVRVRLGRPYRRSRYAQ